MAEPNCWTCRMQLHSPVGAHSEEPRFSRAVVVAVAVSGGQRSSWGSLVTYWKPRARSVCGRDYDMDHEGVWLWGMGLVCREGDPPRKPDSHSAGSDGVAEAEVAGTKTTKSATACISGRPAADYYCCSCLGVDACVDEWRR